MGELRLEDSVVDERYRLQRCLSRGSYAEIFLAIDPERDGQQVIIKALNPFLQGTPDPLLEQTLIENFQNEAIALDKVRHPNIIRRLGHGTASDLEMTPFHYLVLEYMAGGDMLSLCRKHPVSLADGLFYFHQISDGLYFAHCQSVIHRDIKPNNLLMSGDHKIVKIADFGVAKIAPDDSAEITKVGTNLYAPPEHHPDDDTSVQHQPLTPSADIYSLAKTVYTVLSGRAPHQFARRPITALPDNLASATWATALLPVLQKATATSVTERYQSVPDFWQALAQLEEYVPAQHPADDEATIVRGRPGAVAPRRFNVALGSGSASVDHLSRAPRPNFQTVRRTADAEGLPDVGDEKIVVQLPARHPSNAAVPARVVTQENTIQQGPGTVADNQDLKAGPSLQSNTQFKTRAIASEPGTRIVELHPSQAAGAMQMPAREQSPNVPAYYAWLESARNVKWTNWLRGAFILFLVLFLASMVAKVYMYFADPSRPPITRAFGLGSAYEEGVIYGKSNVNIRSEPTVTSGSLAWLPEGSRVRLMDTHGGWVKVKVLRWSGQPPVDAPDGGWVDRRWVKVDGQQ
ncbi:MAG TPA: serine/threonine protein kinase [Blastocatellia bacterium]